MHREAETMPDSCNSEFQVITDSQNKRDIQATRHTVQETTGETTLSDTTGNTPDIFRSPVAEIVVVESEEAETVSLDLVVNQLVQASSKVNNQMIFKNQPYLGVTFVPETEAQVRSSDSEDDIPVVSLLRKDKGTTLTLQ
jgi:hypothetical protein